MAAKKKPGTNIEDWQRGTKRLTLRLKPEVMQLLYSLSTEIGEPGAPETYAKTIEQALHALDREMTADFRTAHPRRGNDADS